MFPILGNKNAKSAIAKSKFAAIAASPTNTATTVVSGGGGGTDAAADTIATKSRQYSGQDQ